MPVFRFKRFEVSNDRSAMKVNTDGVLLGALMTVSSHDRRLLDIGTGTGTVALMAAQRLFSRIGAGTDPGLSACGDPDGNDGRGSGVSVMAIDIDRPSAEEAAENFAASPWSACMSAVHCPLSGFERMLSPVNDGGFDLVFSNPPYFESSLKAPDARRRAARHADTLSYREIMSFSARWLSAQGRLSMILPADMWMEVRRYAVSWGLYPFRMVGVKTSLRRPCTRAVMEFARKGTVICLSGGGCPEKNEITAGPGYEPVGSVLTIMNEGTYSSEYRSLVSDFLLI